MSARQALLGAGLAAGLALSAHAHTALEKAEPRVGATVAAAPAALTLRFTEDLASAACTVMVHDASGRRVDQADARVDERDRTLLRVSLKPLPPGAYKVVWRVESRDDHVAHGDYRLRVAP